MQYENNIIYVDVDTIYHKYTPYNNHSSRIRLYLGKLGETEFERTIDTIKDLPEDKQLSIRSYLKSVFLS